MKLSNLLTLLLLALSATITSACSSESSSAEIEALAYRSSESGRWGIVSMDGEVIVRDYFKNEPTVAMDGRYFVKNDEGLWEMYDLSTQPQKKVGNTSTLLAFTTAELWWRSAIKGFRSSTLKEKY